MRIIDNIVNKSRRRRPTAIGLKKKKVGIGDKAAQVTSKFRWVFILIALVIVGSILINFVLPFASNILSLDFKRDESAEPRVNSEWNGNSRLTILTAGIDNHDGYKFVDLLSLVVIEPEQKYVGVFGINTDLNIFSQSAGKTVNIRTLYNMREAKGKEAKVLIEAVENLLAVRIDRYLITDSTAFADLAGQLQPISLKLDSDLYDKDLSKRFNGIDGWKAGTNEVTATEIPAFAAADANGRNDQLNRQTAILAEMIKSMDSFQNLINFPSFFEKMTKDVRSDLSKRDAFFIAGALWGIRSDQFKFGYTKMASMLKVSSFGPYSRYEPAFEGIDKDLASILYDFNIAREQPRIEVLNGSEVRGLATSRSRWITNTGGRVVFFGNSLESEEKTQIFVEDPEKYPYTLKELERIFNGKVEYPGHDYVHKHIGEIIVVIGKDYQ